MSDALTPADYEEVLAGHRRLVRELDVLLNGEGAAAQASLADLVAQVRRQGARWHELGRAINRAARDLPDGYEIDIEVARHSGIVVLIDTDCDRITDFNGDTLGAQVESAIGYAIERAEELGGDELPDGLTRDEGGTLRYKCRHCLTERQWYGEPQDFDRHNHINCGGSPYCLP